MSEVTKIQKPFIKLFKTPLGYYCYDVNTFSMLRITEGMYELLNGKSELCENESSKRILKLMEKEYLSNHRPKEMKHSYTDILEEYLEHNIRKITLQVTQNCNLACKYCSYANPVVGKQRGHCNKSMPIYIAKQAIDFLFAHSTNEEEINVGFYGGEPLMELDMIKELIDYAESMAKKYHKSLSYAMTTNATMLTEEVIKYFINYNIHILVSLDGPKEIHDKNRVYRKTGKGSFDDVINNLDRIRLKHPEFIKKISINSVLDSENDFSCYNEFFVNFSAIKGFNLMTNSINTDNLSTNYEYKDLYRTQYKYEQFKLLLSLLGKIDNKRVSQITSMYQFDLIRLGKSFKGKNIMLDKIHHSGPCIAGATRLFIDVNGIFFPCERCSEKSEVMRIGDIESGINIDHVNNLLNIGKLTEAECINCWNLEFCLICATKADDLYKFSNNKKLEYCKTSKKSVINRIFDYLTLIEFGFDINLLRSND